MAIKTIPQNIEAEMAVLGSTFLTADAKEKICDALVCESFFLPAHQKIFKAIKALYDEGTPIDITTVKDKIDKNKDLNAIGGVEYLSEIIDSVATASNIDYYINIVKEKAVLRGLINVSTDIITDAYESTDNLNEILDRSDKKFTEVIKTRKTGEFTSMSDLIAKVQENLEKRAKNKSEITGLATGFRALDVVTSGLQPNDLIILAARPSMGKTTFALNIAQYAAINSGKGVAIFSMEMPAEQLILKMISSLGGVEQTKLKTGKLEHNDWTRVNEALSELGDAKLYIEDSSGMNVSEIRARCRRLSNSENGLGLVVIDYLQLIAGGTKYAGQRTMEVSEISRSLKTLAMELKIPIIALSQLSRGPEQREDKRPNLADLRESGSIEQDADIVAFLYRNDYYEKKDEVPKVSISELIISKHRNGSLGTIELLFEPGISSFKNYFKANNEE